jgi:hypothetical protein
MLGTIAAQTTSPATNGEPLRCRTSIGKATVDILLPKIDIEDPNISLLSARFFPALRASRVVAFDVASTVVPNITNEKPPSFPADDI